MNKEIFDQEHKPQLKGVVKTFYQQEIISEQVHRILIDEINTKKVDDVQAMFSRMEEFSLQALPEDLQRRYFPSDTTEVYFPVIMMSQTPFFSGHKELPKKYRTVVDYLHQKKIISETCLATLEKWLFTPSDARDAVLYSRTMEHTFIQIFTKAEIPCP